MSRSSDLYGALAVPRVLLAAAGLVCATTARAEDAAAGSTLPVTVYADLRLAASQGEAAWDRGGFGKLRFGGDGAAMADGRAGPWLGEAGIVWRPSLGWAWSATVVALAQGGGRRDAGLSEAFLSYRPMAAGALRLSARAGLMWPPVSLEHTGGEWRVAETVSPSAINAWIGEEIKPVTLEGTARLALGSQALSGTAGLFVANDTAGTLLAFRGWALHDRKALAFREQPLPPLNRFLSRVQPPYSHPVLNVERDALARPGWYAHLAWDRPGHLHLDVLHYDNRADPEDVNAAQEWGWRTWFTNVGLQAQLAPGMELRAQGMAGRTQMGFVRNQVRWVDTRFRAAYAMLTRRFGPGSASLRFDAFGARNHGSRLEADNDEDGWALTLAARREFGPRLSLLGEVLHVDSTRAARVLASAAARQAQTQVQLVLRARL